MNNSYLVARDKTNGDIRLFLIDEAWYLGEYGKDVYLNNSLAIIDTVTLQYSSFKEMNEKLFGLDINNYENYDVFICGFDEKGAAYFDEVIFASKAGKHRDELLKKVALASMAGEKQAEEVVAEEIVRDFLFTVYSANDFYDMVTDLETGVSGSIIDTCKEMDRMEDFDFDIKFDVNVLSDYRNIRNMVEALYRLGLLSSRNKDDRGLINYDKYVSRNEKRQKVVSKIGREIANPYMDNVVFANGKVESNQKISEANYDRMMKARRFRHMLKKKEEKQEKLEEKKQVVKKNVDVGFDDVSVSTKKREIHRILDTLPMHIFVKSKDTDKFVINKNVFNCDISEEDEVKLNTLLTGNMPLFFLRYAFSRNEYKEANAKGFNLLEYEVAMNDNMKSIETRFRSLKCLDNTYKWCKIYDHYRRLSDLNNASEDILDKRGNSFGKK